MSTPVIAAATITPPYWWPAKLPASALILSFDLSQTLTDIQLQRLESVSVSVAPSGGSELSIPEITVDCGILFVYETLGQPRRVYTILVAAAVGNDEVVQWIVNQGVAALLPTNVPPISPNPSFGSPTMWNKVVTYTLSGSATVSATESGVLVPAGTCTNTLTISTTPGDEHNVWLDPSGAAAVVGSGLLLKAGGYSITFGAGGIPLPANNITAICDGVATTTVGLIGA